MENIYKSPKLSFTQLVDLSLCRFGIQFATSIHMVNMTSVFKYLGAHGSQISYLWLAAPISGLIIQPLIGELSDETSTRLGRRIPYILVWGILAVISLIALPFSNQIWMAAVWMWLFNCSINGSTEGLRALTADLAPRSQKVQAFSWQTIFAGIGAAIAAFLPWLFTFSSDNPSAQTIPTPIFYAFISSALIFGITIAWTVYRVKEPLALLPPANANSGNSAKKVVKKIGHASKELMKNIKDMPLVIKKFYPIQIFTWTGLFCMWLYFSIAIAQQVYGLPVGADVVNNQNNALLLQKGAVLTGVCFGIYQIVSIAFALLLPRIVNKTSPKIAYGITLLCGAASLMAISLTHNAYFYIFGMLGVGIMWGGIMTLPDAIISSQLPAKKMGVYMGIFNITITVPQIISSLILGFITTHFLGGYAVYTLFLGGVLIMIGGILILVQAKPFKLRARAKSYLEVNKRKQLQGELN